MAKPGSHRLLHASPLLLGILLALAAVGIAGLATRSVAAALGLAAFFAGLVCLVGLRRQSYALSSVRKLERGLRTASDEATLARRELGEVASRLTDAQQDLANQVAKAMKESVSLVQRELLPLTGAVTESVADVQRSVADTHLQLSEIHSELGSVHGAVNKAVRSASDPSIRTFDGNPPVRSADVLAAREVAAALAAKGHRLDLSDWDWTTSTAGLRAIAEKLEAGGGTGDALTHPLFDPHHYLATSGSDVAPDRAMAEYLGTGWQELKAQPHSLIDSAWYVERYGRPERAPLLDFLMRESGPAPRQPHPLFDPSWYAEQAGIDRRQGSALTHYVLKGARSGLAPSALFDPVEVDRRIPVTGDHDRLALFLALEARGLLPDAWFEAIRTGSPALSEREQLWDYLVSGLYRELDTVTLFRIIGNDLPPRHESGQTLANVRFVLKHEQLPPQVERHWIVNRVLDADAEHELLQVLKSAGEPTTRIPVERGRVGSWDWHGLPAGKPVYAQSVESGHGSSRGKTLYRKKAGELIGINDARNTALDMGRRRSKWTLPLDGGIFLTASAWGEILDAIRARPYVRYVAIPSTRRLTVELLTENGFRPPSDGEHMLLFRRDAREEFDPWWPYGFRDKVSLLYRLGIPGPWDDWEWEGLPAHRGESPDAYRFAIAGWGARLPTGTTVTDLDRKARFEARGLGIAQLCDRFEADGLHSPRSTEGLLFAPDTLRASGTLSGATLPDEHRELVEGVLATTSATGPSEWLPAQASRQWAHAVASLLCRPDEVGPMMTLGAVGDALAAPLTTSAQDDGDSSVGWTWWLLAWDLRALRLAGEAGGDVDALERDLDIQLLELAHRFDLKQDSAAREVGEAGSWYSVQQLACGLATGRTQLATRALRDLQERLVEQFGDDGQLTEVVGGPAINLRSVSLLEAWTLADVLLRPSGVGFVDLAVDGRTVRQAVSACVQEAAVTGGLRPELQQRVRAVAQTLLPSGDGWSTWSSTDPAVPVDLGGSSHLPPFWMLVHPRGQSR